MSNLYAMSATTATLSYLLRSEGKTVVTKPPDTLASGGPRINIFLYQVLQNAGYRNRDQPGRSFAGDLVTKQQIGLDLYYLITAFGGSDDELSAQKILAESVMTLQEKPILKKELIEAAINDPDIKNQMSDINKSDLSKQIEHVKLNFHPLSLEELTKIWSSFFKNTSYRISVAYKATTVILDGTQEAISTMPVRDRNVYNVIPTHPEITYVQPQIIEPSLQNEITIHGKSLKSETIKIDFGDVSQLADMPSPKFISDQRLVVDLPDSLRTGIKHLKVVHPLLIGTPKTLHRGTESNAAFFAMSPKILAVSPLLSSVGSKITITFEPKINKEQHAVVIIGNSKPLDAEWVDQNLAETDQVEVRIPVNYEKGVYPIRLRIDGAESQPDDIIPNEFKRNTVEIS